MSPILIHFKVAQLRPEKVAQYHRKRWYNCARWRQLMHGLVPVDKL